MKKKTIFLQLVEKPNGCLSSFKLSHDFRLVQQLRKQKANGSFAIDHRAVCNKLPGRNETDPAVMEVGCRKCAIDPVKQRVQCTAGAVTTGTNGQNK